MKRLLLIVGMLVALVVIGVFCLGILLVPVLTSSIFTGRAGGSVLPERFGY